MKRIVNILYSFNKERFDDLNLQFPTIKEATKRYQMKQKMSRKTKSNQTVLKIEVAFYREFNHY